MAEKLAGQWKIEKQDAENFDKYLQKIGIGYLTRKAIVFLCPKINISINDGTWTVLTTSKFKNNTVSFKLDVEQQETTGDGRSVKAFYTVEGNKLTKREMVNKGVSSLMSREIMDDDTMVLTLEALECATGDSKNIVCKRVYVRDESP